MIAISLPTEDVWILDARSNVPCVTKKDRSLSPQHFSEFELCSGSDPNGQCQPKSKDLSETGRFHATEIAERSFKLDITWLKDELLESSDDLPDPQDLATEAITELKAIVGDLREIFTLTEQEEGVETSLEML